MSDVNDWNEKVIADFRANDGEVGGNFAGMSMLLLHTTGRSSGKVRVNPLAYQRVGDGWAIFGSKAGAPTHPDWYRNLVAHPDVTIEVGGDTVDVHARVAAGDERDRIWSTQKAEVSRFAGYEETAGDRVIPVIVLEPR